MTLLEKVTLSLAIWGAGLSSLNTFNTWRKEWPRLLVTRSPEYSRGGAGLGPPHSTIGVSNVGSRPVLVTELKILLPDGRSSSLDAILHTYLASLVLPKRLQEGEQISVLIAHFDLADALRKDGFSAVITLIPTWIDTAGRKYRGRPWRFDVDSGFDPVS